MKDKPTKSTLKNTNKKNHSANNTKNRRKKKHKVKLSQKGVATIAVFILILLVIVITLVSSFINKNNVDKVSGKLNLNMGNSISEIEKTTKIEFNQSASSDILSNLIKFNYISEAISTTKVCGVFLPKWVAYAKTNKLGNTTQFTIYDFTTLQDNILGMEVKERIETENLIGTSDDVLKDALGIKPYICVILEDSSKQYIFRYYYQDSSSNNDVSVQLYVDVDSNGTITNVDETNVNFITTVLSTVEVTTSINEQ